MSLPENQRSTSRNILYFPLEDDSLPMPVISTVLGNAFFGGHRRPSFIDKAHWIDLPFIYEESFARQLSLKIEKYGLQALVTRHPATLAVLNRLKVSGVLQVEILSTHPQDTQNAQVKKAYEVLESVSELLNLHGDADPMRMITLAALLDGVTGATNMSKLWALHELARQSSNGVVVEIGVMFGRSAAALALGARTCGTCFIGVDTWDNSQAVQNEASNVLLEVASGWNRERMQTFAQHLIAYTGCDHRLIKGTSREAVENLKRTHGDFRVSLLHIDANHDYAKVREDWEIWSPFLNFKHTVIFDDTSWSAGEGPRRLVDEISRSGLYRNCQDFAGSTFFSAP